MGSLVETMKIMEDNSYNENEFLKIKKFKKLKNFAGELNSNKIKNVKDFKGKIQKEEKLNRDKDQELINFNFFSENKNIYLRQASPLFNNYAHAKDSKKKSIEKEKFREKDAFNIEPFSENMKKMISKKKK